MSFGEQLGSTIWEILTYTVLSPYYRGCVRSLDMTGDEEVLDFGCGIGGASRHLAELLSRGAGHVTGLDPSESAIETARRRLNRYPNIEFLHGDIRDLSIAARTFDVIFMNLVLYHIDPGARPAIIAELARVLKQDGRLVIRQPVGGDSSLSPEGIKELMAQGGLREVHSELGKTLSIIPTYIGTFQAA